MQRKSRTPGRMGGGQVATVWVAMVLCALIGGSISPSVWSTGWLHDLLAGPLGWVADLLAPLRHLAFLDWDPGRSGLRSTRAGQAMVGALLPLVGLVVVAHRHRRWMQQVLKAELEVFRALRDPTRRRAVDAGAPEGESEARGLARAYLAELGHPASRLGLPQQRTSAPSFEEVEAEADALVQNMLRSVVSENR